MATKTILSWDQFVAAGKEGQKCEWVDGEVVQMTPVNFRHEVVLARLFARLEAYCGSHLDWLWVPSHAVFTMVSGNWRCPDASLVCKERLRGGELPQTRADFPPDVAFEILSAGDNPGVIQRKRKDYLEGGVIQVWIDLERRLVELIYPDQPLRYFQEDQALVIDKLPDFSLPLPVLFSI